MTHNEIKDLLRKNWLNRYTLGEIDTILEIYDYFHNNKGDLENGLSYLQTNYVDVSRIQNLEFNKFIEETVYIYDCKFKVFSNTEEFVHLFWRIENVT